MAHSKTGTEVMLPTVLDLEHPILSDGSGLILLVQRVDESSDPTRSSWHSKSNAQARSQTRCKLVSLTPSIVPAELEFGQILSISLLGS